MQRQSVRNLPTNKNPTGSRCITLQIPDDDEWEVQAYSELYRLALWMLWERDTGKNGAPVAKRWRDALDTWKHCDGTPSPVILSGEFEMSELCELLRWHEGQLQAWCCGEWASIPTDGTAPIPGTGGQPDNGGRPAPGASLCYPVEITYNGTWLLPFAVQSGDIVTIEHLSGAWSNDGISWTCTDGTPFIFGACLGGRYHLGSDPDPDLWHGQLAMFVGGQYLSATDGPVTLSGLSGPSQLTLLGNFDREAGGGGTITLSICVQNNATPPAVDWCYYMDFSLLDYDFVSAPLDGSGWGATYIPGVGWRGSAIALAKHMSPATTITEVQLWRNRTPSGTHVVFSSNPDWTGSHTNLGDVAFTGGSPAEAVESDPLAVPDGYYMILYGVDDPGYDFTAVQVRGTGVNPFGSTNCT